MKVVTNAVDIISGPFDTRNGRSSMYFMHIEDSYTVFSIHNVYCRNNSKNSIVVCISKHSLSFMSMMQRALICSFHQLLWWKNKKTEVVNHKITVKIKVIFISTGTSHDNYVTIITQTVLKGGGKVQEKAEKQELNRIILWGNST